MLSQIPVETMNDAELFFKWYSQDHLRHRTPLMAELRLRSCSNLETFPVLGEAETSLFIPGLLLLLVTLRLEARRGKDSCEWLLTPGMFKWLERRS